MKRLFFADIEEFQRILWRNQVVFVVNKTNKFIHHVPDLDVNADPTSVFKFDIDADNHPDIIYDISGKEPIFKNAVTCGICRSPADRYSDRFECQSNPCHIGDLNVGMFSDLSFPTGEEQNG